MSKITILRFLAMICVVVSKSLWLAGADSDLKIAKVEGGISPQLKFVVNIDGKSYFAENTYMNWTDADVYCKSLGMKLATITSENQWTALVNAYSSDFHYSYWTAARDCQKLRQFSWNETETELNGAFIKFQALAEIPYQTCGMFRSLSANQSHMHHYQCSHRTNILCET